MRRIYFTATEEKYQHTHQSVCVLLFFSFARILHYINTDQLNMAQQLNRSQRADLLTSRPPPLPYCH